MSDEQTDQKSGWYMNEAGEVCFQGQCIKLTAHAKGDEFDIEVDESCDIAEVAKANRALRRAGAEGQINLKTKKAAR